MDPVQKASRRYMVTSAEILPGTLVHCASFAVENLAISKLAAVKTSPMAVQSEVPATGPGLSKTSVNYYNEELLRGPTLSVAVLVFLALILLAALLWLVLTGLAALLSLTGLAPLLALALLPGLPTLLTLFLPIVCHEISPKKAWDLPPPSEFIALHSLGAAGDCKGCERFRRPPLSPG